MDEKVKHKISTIINYCTNDYRYLKLCTEAVKSFSSEIIIPVCDHLFNGEKENRFLLNRSYAENPDCMFVEYTYPFTKPYGSNPSITPDDVNYKHYMHSTSRYLGYLASSTQSEYVLFLDVDEIVDTDRFIKWLNEFEYAKHDALRFFNYFYFRNETYRSKSGHSVNALLLKKSSLNDPEKILTIHERRGLYLELETDETPIMLGIDGAPLFHHYSWVRTKEELEKKVTTWGHAHENNWLERIEDEFSSDFMFIDSVFYNMYEKVTPLHEPSKEKIPSPAHSDFSNTCFSHVTYISQSD